MLSESLSERLLVHFYKYIYAVINPLGIKIPEELDFSQRLNEGEVSYYMISINDDLYTMFVTDENDDLRAGFFLISSFLPLIENMNSSDYDMAISQAKMVINAINLVGKSSIVAELSHLLEGEITIEEKVYIFSSVDIRIDDANSSGFEDLMQDAKGINIEIHYEPL